MKLFLLLALSSSIMLAACRKTSAPSTPQEIPTLSIPPKVLSVRTILTHSRDTVMTAPDTATDFDIRDTIHGIIETQNALDGTELIGRWYYVKTGQQIAQSSATLSAGTNLSHFDLTNETPWPLGQYKLIVLIDSVVRDSARFTVENKR